MVALARKTLLHEWRRFLPAVLAIGFACLLQLLQVAFVRGIFSSASVYVTGSGGDLWAGYKGTQSINLGRPVQDDLRTRLLMDPEVVAVEPFIWLDADWRGASGNTSVYVTGIDERPEGAAFSRVLPLALRMLLVEPNSVIVDRADLQKLGAGLGASARINGRLVRVVGIAQGLRGLGGVNVVSSLQTARYLGSEAATAGPTYFVARLKEPGRSGIVASRLCCNPAFGAYEVWTAEQFARRSELYWLFDTGAGAGVLFLAVIVFAAGAAISSQALLAAVAGSIREYAMLNALGIGIGNLRWIVLEQAFWVGAAGLICAITIGGALLWIAQMQDVPVLLDFSVTAFCIVVALGVAAVSGLFAVHALRRADPATLLR